MPRSRKKEIVAISAITYRVCSPRVIVRETTICSTDSFAGSGILGGGGAAIFTSRFLNHSRLELWDGDEVTVRARDVFVLARERLVEWYDPNNRIILGTPVHPGGNRLHHGRGAADEGPSRHSLICHGKEPHHNMRP